MYLRVHSISSLKSEEKRNTAELLIIWIALLFPYRSIHSIHWHAPWVRVRDISNIFDGVEITLSTLVNVVTDKHDTRAAVLKP